MAANATVSANRLARAKDLLQQVMDDYPEEAYGSAWLEEAQGLIGRSQGEIEEVEDDVIRTEGILVTTEDLSGRQLSESREIEDDYLIVCAGSCYIAHTNYYPTTGTVQLTIKGVRGR